MNPYPKLNIEKYEVDLEKGFITFYLREHQGKMVGEAIFKGVLGHQFTNVLSGNYVTSIKECSPEEFHQKYTAALEEYQQRGLPFSAYKPTEFFSDIKRRSLKPMIITGQYGFSGWVLCENAQINLGGAEVSYE
jgi:hypothetical protein